MLLFPNDKYKLGEFTIVLGECRKIVGENIVSCLLLVVRAITNY